MTTLESQFATIVRSISDARSAARKCKQAGDKDGYHSHRQEVRAGKKARAEFLAMHPDFTPPAAVARASSFSQVQAKLRKKAAPETVAADTEAEEEATEEEAAPGVAATAAAEVAVTAAEQAVAAAEVAVRETLTERALRMLNEGHQVTPAQAAAWISSGWDATINAKQAADVLGKLAKAGKAHKEKVGNTVVYSAPIGR